MKGSESFSLVTFAENIRQPHCAKAKRRSARRRSEKRRRPMNA
jgi:hypothetical protein